MAPDVNASQEKNELLGIQEAMPSAPGIAEPVFSQFPPFAKYYLYDHLGNTRMLYHVECKLVQAGEPPLYNGVRYFVDQAIDYYPFGKVLREYILSGSSNTKYKSTGHERDKETSLDYRLARYYDSEIGRFLAVDPMKEKHLDHSPYSYCANNPILFLDPDGRDWYKDSEGHYRYNKDLNSVNSISILKKGETWLGFKYTEQTKNGTNEYRSDGSIFWISVGWSYLYGMGDY